MKALLIDDKCSEPIVICISENLEKSLSFDRAIELRDNLNYALSLAIKLGLLQKEDVPVAKVKGSRIDIERRRAETQ